MLKKVIFNLPISLHLKCLFSLQTSHTCLEKVLKTFYKNYMSIHVSEKNHYDLPSTIAIHLILKTVHKVYIIVHILNLNFISG